MPSKKGLSKKEIKRFKKADLVKLCKEYDVQCSKKDSKALLVDKVFKSKKMRSSLHAPEKRKMSEKQMSNLARFRKGSDFKNEKKIKQRAQYVAEIAKIEDTSTMANKKFNDDISSGKKLGEGSGRFQNTQVKTLKDSASLNQSIENTRKRELIDSTTKTSDTFDQALSGIGGRKSKRRLRIAESQAKSTKDKRFGQEEGDPVLAATDGESILDLMSLPGNELIVKLRELKKGDPTNPVVILIEGLLSEKKKLNSSVTEVTEEKEDSSMIQFE